MRPEKRYQELASKWLNNTISLEEKKEFADWYNANQNDEVLIAETLANNEEEHKQRILSKINQRIASIHIQDRRRNTIVRKIVAAACLFIIFSAGAYFYEITRVPGKYVKSVKNDIAPGGNRALLKLASGKTIDLDQAATGSIINEPGIKIQKSKNGQLLYTISGSRSSNSAPTGFNTITTPKGGQYQVVLPDGTRVWLNAASSLTFPVVYSSHERRVALKGEAYFEVAHNAAKPFIVEASEQEIKVLGTHFNVNAYSEEPMSQTTLLEGSVLVKLTGNQTQTILKPGQQARVSAIKQRIDLRAVDVAEFTAWKNGYFYFKDTDIYSVMRQFSRWYNVEVFYESTQFKDLFVGKIPRSATLSEALRVLEAVGVKFKLDGRKLYIMAEKPIKQKGNSMK